MKTARSGTRGVFWRPSPQGTQELRREAGTERGDWWIRWKCGHGHRPHREKVGPTSAAQKRVEQRRLERYCPTLTERPTKHLLRDVIREYLAAAKHKRSAKDDARYGAMWSARWGGRLLEDVAPADLERYKSERLESVKPATVNRELAFLKHVYNVAIRDEKTERNPVAKIKLASEPSGRTRWLNDEEEARLMAALPSDDDRDRLTVLLNTGFRKAEFLGLRWCDVDLKANVATIPRSKNGATKKVLLNSTVRAILSRLPRSLDRNAFVFPNGQGGRDLRWAEKTIPRAVQAAGIADFRLHDTRHTFASRLAMGGEDVLTIKELGGWKTLNMVARYAHLSAKHQRAAVERLSQSAATTTTESAVAL